MGSEVLSCNSNNSWRLYRSGVNSNMLLFPRSYFIFKLNIAYANNFGLSEKICVCHDIARDIIGGLSFLQELTIRTGIST